MADAHGALAYLGVADHHARHFVGGEVFDLAAADLAASTQHSHAVAEARHFAELVRDHDDRDLLAMRHVAQEAKHFVRFARRQHRGRLVEDEEALVEIQELQDFKFLLFARRHGGDRHIERHAKRHAVEKLVEPAHLFLPVDDGGCIGAADDEIFRAGQRRHQREMLIHHADAVRAGVTWIADRHFLAVEQDLAAIRRVEAHDAFDERRLAGAVFAEEGVHSPGFDLDGDVFECDQRSEDLGHADRLQRWSAHRRRGHLRSSIGDGQAHGRFSTKFFELDTEPNTPPCILTILIAARWLP